MHFKIRYTTMDNVQIRYFNASSGEEFKQRINKLVENMLVKYPSLFKVQVFEFDPAEGEEISEGVYVEIPRVLHQRYTFSLLFPPEIK